MMLSAHHAFDLELPGVVCALLGFPDTCARNWAEAPSASELPSRWNLARPVSSWAAQRMRVAMPGRARSRTPRQRAPEVHLTQPQWDILQAIETLLNADQSSLRVISSHAAEGNLPTLWLQDNIHDVADLLLAWHRSRHPTPVAG